MLQPALAVVVVIAAWWLSTALVLRLVWLRPTTHAISVAASSVLALVALEGVVVTSASDSVGAAYLAFGCALTVWAWHELTFLLGLVTGPRRAPCPPGARGWARFRFATAAVIHHEIALALTAVVLVALTWGAPNQVATLTFLVLWVMRLSAKLNLFLGVDRVSDDFIPVRLRYLLTYFRRARFNPLMPLSLVASALVTWSFAASALSDEVTTSTAVGHSLIGTIVALALLEHLFLVLPVRDALLWRWVLRSEDRVAPPPRPRASWRSLWSSTRELDEGSVP
ncbi:MAG: putative photosynthetic complex assembly protein PuhE [Sandaracinaceae bacterium]